MPLPFLPAFLPAFLEDVDRVVSTDDSRWSSAACRGRSSGGRPFALVSSLFSALLLVLPLPMTASTPPVLAEERAEDHATDHVGPRTGTATSADGVEIAYTVYGPRGDHARRPVLDLVFVHGWACDQSFWREQVEPFSDLYRVVTLDLAGHGRSGSDRETWNVQGFGPDIVAVVEAEALEHVVLVGHSMGGPAVLEAAPALRDRLVGVVGVDTFHDADFALEEEQWQPFVEAYRRDFDGTCRQAVAAMVGSANDALARRVTSDMCDADPEIATALMASFGVYRGAPALARVEAPVRAINAGSGMPTRIERNRGHNPRFDAVVVPEVGHFLMLEAPETFNRELRAVLEMLATTVVPAGKIRLH